MSNKITEKQEIVENDKEENDLTSDIDETFVGEVHNSSIIDNDNLPEHGESVENFSLAQLLEAAAAVRRKCSSLQHLELISSSKCNGQCEPNDELNLSTTVVTATSPVIKQICNSTIPVCEENDEQEEVKSSVILTIAVNAITDQMDAIKVATENSIQSIKEFDAFRDEESNNTHNITSSTAELNNSDADEADVFYCNYVSKENVYNNYNCEKATACNTLNQELIEMHEENKARTYEIKELKKELKTREHRTMEP